MPGFNKNRGYRSRPAPTPLKTWVEGDRVFMPKVDDDQGTIVKVLSPEGVLVHWKDGTDSHTHVNDLERCK
jgi:hypothetical protein